MRIAPVPFARWIAAVVMGVAALGALPALAQLDETPPWVVGLPIAEAEATLRDWRSDVTMRILNTEPPSVEPADVVVAEQSLANPGWSIEQIPPVVDLTLGVAMPYLEGRTWAEARALLDGSGLVPSPLLDGAADDLVVTLAPTAGLPVAFGSEVRVKLEPATATTPEPTRPSGVEVPAIVGLRVDEAEALLAEAGLQMELDVIGDEGEVGPIASQDPEAGTTVEVDALVTATAERVTPEHLATDDSIVTTGDEPVAGAGEREGTDRSRLVTAVIALAGVVIALAVGAIHQAGRRARDRRDLDWIGTHVTAAPRLDVDPAMAAQEVPGKPHRDVRLIGERGPAPTFTEEVSK